MKRGQNPFRRIISEQARLFRTAKKLKAHKTNYRDVQQKSLNTQKVLIFSPHPDDECITGALPLRLSREAKWKIINLAVTLGSKRKRRRARLRELKNACDYLGFDLIVANFDAIHQETRQKNSTRWQIAIKTISEILAEQKPLAIFLPHENDVHPTHVGTHLLVLDALKRLPAKFSCFVFETEFWGQLTNPNMLVESSVDDVADLVEALSLHEGEVKRNPYHARLPASMIDNVRRGTELVGKRGSVAPDFVFGTVYRLRKWQNRKLQNVSKSIFLNAEDNPKKIFKHG